MHAPCHPKLFVLLSLFAGNQPQAPTLADICVDADFRLRGHKIPSVSTF
jgi:hypothetical protein